MKLNFKKIGIEDKSLFEKILSDVSSNSFSKSFGSYFLWAESFKIKMCFDNGILYVKYHNENPTYEMPKGSKTDENLKKAINSLLENHKNTEKSKEFKFIGLTKQEAEKLKKLFPDKFEITPERNDFEYIYSAKALAELKGKKYHSKRGHIAKFSKINNWKYEPLNMDKKQDYIEFFKLWFKEKQGANPNEMKAIEKSLNYYNELELYGGAIYVDEKIAACAIGEKINSETFVVHFEKALGEFADAYTVINNELCKHIQSKYKYINREEDLGISGLRKAKLSYHPICFIEKYSAVAK